MRNPLLNFDQRPFFSKIQASHVLPALNTVLTESRKAIEILGTLQDPNWESFALPMENLDERIDRIWSPVSHLNSVSDSDELRHTYQKGIQLLTEYHCETSQNRALFTQYKKIRSHTDFARLNPAQQKIIHNNLLNFRLSGAELTDQQQQHIREIDQALSESSNQFERNVLDATQAWQKRITDQSELSGLPNSALNMARQLAGEAKQAGWLFTLQAPSYLAVMQYADNRDLRREMYEAYCTRASKASQSPEFDNTDIIVNILRLRNEKATLLSFDHYADFSLVKKMAQSSTAVIEFLHDLVDYAKPVALQEIQELQKFARASGAQYPLEAWDISYYSEKLREQQYAFNDEQVKPYFPAPHVFDGLFEITHRLFGISIEPNITMDTWHKDVRCFNVLNQNGALLGQFYCDLYMRKHKRGGAWMDACIHRRVNAHKVQLPVAFLTCNFSPPIGDTPALLTHTEVETLFHEFGHTLHHLLTQVDEMSVAGINGVAWDAVELPSQFLENWCWHEQSLKLIAHHYKNGETIPNELIAKMRAAKNFQSGMQNLRQIEFALFDIRLHSEFKTDIDNVQTLLDEVRTQVSVIIPPANNRFQNSFVHIFAGGYAAGYYSYKWSEVLSADAFGRFAEEGIFNPRTGRDFLRTILERGGVDDPNMLFEEFRGRPPKIESLLQQTGIL